MFYAVLISYFVGYFVRFFELDARLVEYIKSQIK